jgi:magnesium transporter
VPSLPRIKRPRPRTPARDVATRPEPRAAEQSAHGLTWVHLDAPRGDEAGELAQRFGWHPLDIEDVLSKRQRPKIDEYADEGYLFVVLHFPVYDKAVQRLNAAELDAFVGHDYLVTLPNVELLPVTRLFLRCEEDEELRSQLFSKGSGYLLYHVLDDLFDYCFPILDKIGHKLDSIEDEMFEGRAKEVVEALEDTNESVISHRQNDVLRVLTVVSVILLPLTLITGIFGMNVHFPGFGSATAFWAIAGVMLALAVGLIAFFRHKRWL